MMGAITDIKSKIFQRMSGYCDITVRHYSTVDIYLETYRYYIACYTLSNLIGFNMSLGSKAYMPTKRLVFSHLQKSGSPNFTWCDLLTGTVGDASSTHCPVVTK